MPTLGSLWWTMGIKDLTDADLKKIEDKLKNVGIELDTKKFTESLKKSVESYKGNDLALGVKTQYLHDAIRAALKQPEFPIKVTVNKAEAQDAVREALRRAGLQQGFTASDKRQYDAETKRLAAMQVAQAKAAASNALAQQRLARAHKTASSAAGGHAKATLTLDSALKGNLTITRELGTAIGAAYSVVALKNFMQKVIDIGGELEKQKLAMKAILGDEGMANTISSQINTLAVKSPFGIMELNQYAKQLTAFQIPYNELYDTMKRMADVSAAVGVDMGRIILAYGQVRAAKFLKGTELRQFTEANIPLIDMLAERFTKLKGEIVSAGDIMDMISKKEVSFEDVKAVLWELTGEGGRFYNMQEVLSESLQAKWKNLADAIDLMFADIADSLGGPLKGLAEILTELTSKWQTIAVAVGAAASVFGVAKVQTLVWNAALSQATISAIAHAKSTKLIEAGNLRVASTYRKLTIEEKSLLSSKKKLVAEDYRQLMDSGALTKELTLRLIALKKISPVQAHYLMTQGLITAEEYKSAIAAKAWRIRLEQLKVSLAGFGRSLAGAFLNPVSLIMASVGALAALWERNLEEMQKAKDLGEDLFTASAEGAKNIKQILDSTPASSRGMNDVELASGIEKLKQTIKDYSSTADKDLLAALVNQKGEVASLAEQYDILREKTQQLQDAMNSNVSSQMSKTLASAIDDADNGLFDDNLITDIDDFAKAFNNSQKYLAEAIKDNKSQLSEMVKMAKEASPAFASMALSLKTDEQAFAELIKNYSSFAGSFYGKLKKSLFKFYSGYAQEFYGEQREFEQEFKQAIAKQIGLLAVEGIKPGNVTPEQKINLLAWFDKVTEPLPEEGKRIAREIFEGMWKIDLDDGRAERAVVDAFGRALEAAHPELAKRLKAGLAINDLKLVDYASATTMVMGAADEVIAKMPQFRDKVQGFLNDNQFYARVLVEWQALGQDSELKKMLWSGDEKNLRIDAFGAEKIFDRMASGAQSTRDVRDNYIKEGKDIKERIKAAKANNAAASELEKLNAKWNLHAESFRRAHFGDLETAVKEKNGGGGKDPFAESLKQRFKDIKDAWSEFQKWSKTEGREAAAIRIGGSGLFSTLSAEQIPQTVEQYRALVVELENELRKAGVRGTARESLLNDLLKQLLDIDKTVVDEQLKLALDKVSKEAERQLADWNLYEKVRKTTGNETLAFNLAFGMNGDGQTDYVRLMKDKFDAIAKEYGSAFTYDTATPELLQKERIQEVQKAYEQAYGDISKYHQKESEEVADILAKYQSLQDKLAKIDYDRNEEIRRINESKDLTPEQKAQTIQRINVEADYQKFTQSTDYLRFFNDIYGLTMDEANRIGDLIQLNLNQKLQAGLITIYDYEQQMEKVRKQLESLRNVKSDAMTFLTSGLKGLNQKRLQKAEGELANNKDYQKALADQIAAQNALNKAKEEGNEEAVAAAEAQLTLANQSIKAFTKIRDAIIADQEKMQNILDVANIVSNIAGGLSDAFNSIRDMADAFGVDTESGAWGDIGAVMDTLTAVTGGVQKVVQSAMSGDIGGVISGAVSTITTPFTIWAQLHDKKLQKMIERSKEYSQQLQYINDAISRRMEYFLGNAADMKVIDAERDKAELDKIDKRISEMRDKLSKSQPGITRGLLKSKIEKDTAESEKLRKRVEAYDEGGAYGYQRQLMAEQLSELEKQRQAELDKKKTDNSVVADYDNQIDEMKVKIQQFAEETANALYGIDLNGWAEQLGSSLVDAFAAGEDAAEAFDKTVGDIMRDVTSKMISQDILAPMFGDLRNYLFGDNGMGGAFGSDFKLDASEVAAMKTYLDKIKNEGIPAAEELFNAINNATGGMLDDTEKAKSGLSAGIQSVTEDTADLLASYVNAIRASVALNEGRWERLLNESLPQISVIAQSQLDAQKQIAENTLRTAKATEAIVKSNDDISRLLTRVSQGGAKFYIH